MRVFIIFGLLLMILTFPSCNSYDDLGVSGQKIELLHQAGTTPDTSWNFLPYPAHFGKLNGHSTFVLSKSSHPGSSRMVKPIAELHIKISDQQEKWIVAVDTHPDFQIDDLNSVTDLMTTHSGIKSTLERWITYHRGLGQVQLEGWKDVQENK